MAKEYYQQLRKHSEQLQDNPEETGDIIKDNTIWKFIIGLIAFIPMGMAIVTTFFSISKRDTINLMLISFIFGLFIMFLYTIKLKEKAHNFFKTRKYNSIFITIFGEIDWKLQRNILIFYSIIFIIILFYINIII